MKDVGIKYVEVVPSQTVLEFMGRAQASSTTDETDKSLGSKEPGSIMLKGEALFSLSRTIKIRGLTVKFKGMSNSNFQGHSLQIPVLPKLKQVLFAKTTLPPGEHVIPFLLEVPNIYPPSLKSKRATVSYRIELSIAVGLQKKAITAEYPIEVRRHLLRYREMAPLVETQICQDTLPAKFHYEIEAPQIVSLEQGCIPAAIKYLCFASQKSVRAIRTQLRQIEVYSSDGKNVYRKLQNMGDSVIFPSASSSSISGSSTRNQKRYVKHTVPALLHSVDSDQERSTWIRPMVIRHKLQKQVTLSLESPVVSIEHELEVTFQFEHQFENIKAKIPIVIASVPPQLVIPIHPMPKYPFEEKYARASKSTFEADTSGRRLHHNQAHLHSQLKHSLDEERLFPGRHEKKASATAPIRKFASACNLSSLSHQSDEDDDDDNDNDNGGSDDPQHSKQQWALKYQQYLSPPQQLKQRQLMPHRASVSEIPISQRRQKRHLLRPIDVDLANGTKKSQSLAKNYRPRATSMQLDRIYSESSSTDSSDENNHGLRSRPPSAVHSTAPGLPAVTELMPQARPVPLVEESFIHDIVHRGNRSPGLATIASSTILSPTTILDQLDAYPNMSFTRTKEPSFPARPPPPQFPLPPLPTFSRPPIAAAAAAAESSAVNSNPYINLDLPPIPQRRPQRTSIKSHRMTKLYVEDSDDEVIDPSPPITYSSASFAHQQQLQHSSLDIMLPRLSLGSEFTLDL